MAARTSPTPQRRGEALRRHVLLVAKDVFIDAGSYERVSMDAVAARAGTSKRSLYAHFETKEKLFAAALQLVRELYLGRLGTPDDYADEVPEAVTLYCARFLQLMLWGPQLRTCRLCMSQAERNPDIARAYVEAMVDAPRDRLAVFLRERLGLDAEAAATEAGRLLTATTSARWIQALFSAADVVESETSPSVDALPDDVDLDAIRARVAAAELGRASAG